MIVRVESLLEVTTPNKDIRDLYTRINGSFEIICTGDSQIKFKFKGEDLDPNAKDFKIEDQYTSGKHIGKLKKINVNANDEGNYACVESVQADSREVNVIMISPEWKGAVATAPGKSAVMFCSVPQTTPSSLTYTTKWIRNGKEVHNMVDKYKINETDNSLLIEKIDYDKDLGVYQCVIVLPQSQNLTLDVTLSAIPFVAYFNDRSINVHPGDDVQLDCSAKGYPVPILRWKKGNELVQSGGNIEVSNITLKISNVDYDDKGTYYCIADSGSELQSNRSIVVRVKDPLAVLYPIIGIVVQCIILAVIIFFYERNRKKRKQDQQRQDETVSLTEPNETELQVRKRNT